ncbi:neuromedin-S isoform X3 [Microtus ochrogaster]|uniref:Neuromedin-S isoform X3 n=1 Tax=Microtus ochrogaster TaxID=79684 RepID=A0ABM1UHU6_MICOH|nr:neuromedin-S isoform X3 [Microtus ochrogaster]
MQGRESSLPLDPGKVLTASLNNTHLWPAKRSQTSKMKHLPPQFPSVLVIYCVCMLKIPSSGVSQPLADSPDGLDIAELEENQDVYKRFLFHYSRAQKPTHPTNSEFVPVHPLMRLAAKLSSRRMKRLPHPDSGAATVDFPKKGPTSTWGRPFFLFRSRNGRYINNKFQ